MHLLLHISLSIYILFTYHQYNHILIINYILIITYFSSLSIALYISLSIARIIYVEYANIYQ